MSTTMRAMVIGEEGVLTLTDVRRLEPGAGQVRIAVRAAGVNRADLLQRRGLYPAPPGWPADIPGLEVAGVIDAVGDGVRLWRPGDEVMAVVGGGGYAELAVVHEREAIRVPKGVPVVEAAAIPEAYLTAWDALANRLRAQPGETVLIHAVGSGVGLAAMMLARDAGMRVVGTSRTADKIDGALELGLHIGIVADASWPKRVLAKCGPVECVLDLVGGPYLDGNMKVLASQGRLAEVGLTGGRKAEMDLGLLLSKRITVVGTALRSRPLEEKAALARSFERRVVPRFEAEALQAAVCRRFPIAEAEAAHDFVESNATFGKVLLTW